MTQNQNSFLFSSLDDDNNKVSSTRKVHLRRLADILYVCIHKRDWQRASRAWAILTRCPEFDWKAVWSFGVIFASVLSVGEGEKESMAMAMDMDVPIPANSKSVEYLRILMLRMPRKKVFILREIVIHLINRGEHRQALEELELYLPSFPYQEDITLNIYAALIHLYLSFQARNSSSTRDEIIMQVQTHNHECKMHLRRASELGKDHPMLNQISVWLESNTPIFQSYYHQTKDDNASESDENTAENKYT